MKRFWTALSENIQCPAVSDVLRITTQPVVKFVSCIASKYCDTRIICLCLSVEHAALTGNSAILVVCLHRGGRLRSQLLAHTNVATVEELHLLSPSNDTRRCTTHVCPRHTAKIQRSCRPCTYAHVLEESAEVRNTGASPRCQKRRVAQCPGHSSARVCQEPFPPRTEHHRPRSPSNNLPRAKWEV